MKIALYYPWIHLRSGVEKTILEILKKSKHTYTIFTHYYDKENTYPEFKNYEIHEFPRVPVKRNIFSVFKAALTILTGKYDFSGFDLLFIHSDGLGDLIKIRNRKIRTLIYCYTPLRPVFDRYYRKTALQKLTFPSRIVFYVLSYIFFIIDHYIWQKTDYVLFDSRETYYRAKSGKLLTPAVNSKICHLGINLPPANLAISYKKFFFLPGRIMWTKNIELAISAFKIFKKKHSISNDFKLVIAGQVDAKSGAYFSKLRRLAGNLPNIVFIIDPDQAALTKLYRECWAVVSSAFNEDWGLTLLEGNSYRKPAIAVNRGGPSESQIHERTGLLCSENPQSFSTAFHRLASDSTFTKCLGQQAYLNVKKYTSAKYVKSVDKVIDSLSKPN